jgi:hypothetical protein
MELSNPQNIFRSSYELTKWVHSQIYSYNFRIGLVGLIFGAFSYYVGVRLYRDIKIKYA